MDESTLPFNPVEIQLGAADYTAALGSSVTVMFSVTNRSGREDYFDVTVQGLPMGWLLLDLPVIHLNPGERREASLAIQTPANSPGSAGTYPVVLRIASQSNPNWANEVRFQLHVTAVEQTVIPAAMEPAAGERIGIALNTTQFSASPGETIAIPVVISNRGMSEDTFYLAVDGLPQEWVSAATPTIRLLPGEHREVTLYIQPPAGPASRAGRHPFTIRAVAQSNPRQPASVDALLTLAAVSAFRIDLAPRRVDAGQPVRLRIFNLGNYQDTYTILWQSPEGVLEFIPTTNGPIRVNPGEPGVVDFAAAPRHLNLFGGLTIFPYTVVVQSASSGTQSYTGQVASRPIIPIWVLPVLIVLCLGLLCALGFLWNWNQNRLTNATETAQAQIGLVSAGTATAVQGQTLTAAAVLSVPPPTNAPTGTPTLTPTITTSPSPAPPTVTGTAPPTPTPTTPPPTPTDTPVPPTPTNTPPPPTPTPTPTPFPIPVTGQQLIVFESNRSGSSQLYLFNTANRSLTRLTNDGGSDAQPAWSPDGSKIAFTSNRDGNNEIYVMNADGSNPTNLTNDPANDNSPAWSPDGAKIAFTTNRDGNNEIYSMNADGSSPTNLTNNPGSDFRPAWYAQGGLLGSANRIVFTSDRDGNNEIYGMNADGSDQSNLTKSPANDSLPAVPAKGGKIAFVSDRDGNLEIYAMNPDGSSPTNLSKNPATDTMPAWSPDGKWLAFTTNRDGTQQVYIMSADGKQQTNITRSSSDNLDPAWH